MRWTGKPRDEQGLTIILLALTITSVLISAAFAVDVGWWYVRAQQAQRAADAAALAGVVWMPGDFSKAVSTARESAKANGFVDGVANVSVQVTVGVTERQLAVRIVDGKVARFFSGASSNDPVSIGRRAVAQYELPVPLGGPENQMGGGINGMHLAVNGFCSRRSEGDQISSAYFNPSPSGNIDCRTPYATPTSPVAKNPDYRAAGYTYVVSIPPRLSGAACVVASPPPDCSHTGTDVTIQVQDPKTNTNTVAPVADIYSGYANAIGCASPPSRPAATLFSVYRADLTPLDDSDNLPMAVSPTVATSGLEAATSILWEDLVTVPLGSQSGRYLVRVKSAADQACASWSNAFGIRAQRGSTAAPFTLCSTIASAANYAANCPQVHGLDAMSLRASVAGSLAPCTTTSVPGDLCVTFYLAQVDPAYAGRQMVITLFDPGEGAQRLRVLAPDRTTASGLKSTPFNFATVDTGSSMSGSAGAANGLNVSGTPSPFNDRKLQLSLTIPAAADLAVSSGWFKVEYEVLNSSTLVDRTTWGVTVGGTPVHLVV